MDKIIERARASGGDPVSLSYWDRGGPPGRGYSSNLLEVKIAGSAATAHYTKARFAQDLHRFRVQEFEMAIPTDEALALMKDAQPALSGVFLEERDPDIGDVTKVTISAAAGELKVERTFFESLPGSLEDLKKKSEALMARCEQQGHSVPVTAQ